MKKGNFFIFHSARPYIADVVKSEKRTKEESKMSNKKNDTLSAVWSTIVAIIAIILILLTLGVFALRFGDFLPEGTDIHIITPKDPSFEMRDDEIWETNAEIDIFSFKYVNGENVVTVLSQDGSDVIAPGTTSEYDFSMYNDGNMAMKYELSFSFTLSVKGEKTDVKIFPLSIRLKNSSNSYVIGDANSWKKLKTGEMGIYKGVLGASSYERFFLEICWEFDGNDELDTVVGSQSAKDPIDLKFNIHTFAETHTNPSTQGGIIVSEGVGQGANNEFGGMIRWELLMLILVLLVSCVVFLVMKKI